MFDGLFDGVCLMSVCLMLGVAEVFSYHELMVVVQFFGDRISVSTLNNNFWPRRTCVWDGCPAKCKEKRGYRNNSQCTYLIFVHFLRLKSSAPIPQTRPKYNSACSTHISALLTIHHNIIFFFCYWKK